jgi:hypothetical protein
LLAQLFQGSGPEQDHYEQDHPGVTGPHEAAITTIVLVLR